MSFEWHVNEPPPAIEEHSKAKLTVLRDYLRANTSTGWVSIPCSR